MRVSPKLTSAAAALSALATLACCLPLGIAGALTALGLGLALETLRPWLIALSLLCLGIGLLQIYRGRNACRPRRWSLALLALSAAIVLSVFLFPQTVARLLAGLPARTPSGQPALVFLDPAFIPAFEAEFNRAPGVRMILLLSPT